MTRELATPTLTLEEYNYLSNQSYHWDTLPRRTNVARPYDDEPTGYIHVKDINAQPTAQNIGEDFYAYIRNTHSGHAYLCRRLHEPRRKS